MRLQYGLCGGELTMMETEVLGLSIFDLIKVNFVITRRSYNEENPEISLI